VTMEEFEKAKDKIMMGAERKTMVMSEKEKESTAYHEAGHAIVGCLSEEHDPVHKVTIIPRGRALGVTFFLPEADRISESRRKIMGDIATAYGGRIAEEMLYGKEGVSTGASQDIKMATHFARAMVVNYGLSDALGPLDYDSRDSDGIGSRHVSNETSRLIDQEIKSITSECYARAEKILDDNRDILESMKEALMEYETIDSNQVADLMNRQKVRAPASWDDKNGGSSASSVEETDLGEQSDSDDASGDQVDV
jgi:cell division protease FtsH